MAVTRVLAGEGGRFTRSGTRVGSGCRILGGIVEWLNDKAWQVWEKEEGSSCLPWTG